MFSLRISKVRLFYRPQRSCEGYVFTPVCLSTERGDVFLSACWDTILPGAGNPPDQTRPPRNRNPPGTRPAPPQQTQSGPDQTRPPGSSPPPQDQTRPPSRQLLVRTVRILLECILVSCAFNQLKK